MAASYPTSLKSFTTKTDAVDDVLASHMNSVQEEIAAVQTALGINWKGVVQVVTTQATGVVNCATTGTTLDDTVPAITDGVEILSRTITPIGSSNLLYFFIAGHAAINSGAVCTAHLHKDGGNAVAAMAFNIETTHSRPFILTHSEAAGGTSSQTWSVRLNPSSGGNTAYVNGDGSGTRLFGGVSSTKIVIVEVKV